MKWFTSDLHLAHKNIIKYCDRPFLTETGDPDPYTMRQTLIDNFRSVIHPGDELYILGDLSFDHLESLSFLKWVPGQKFFVWGNHDPKKPKHRELLSSMCVKTADIMETKLKDGKLAVLCHFPMLSWNKSHFGSYMLHGHCHGKAPYAPKSRRILDVGVDNELVTSKYFPVAEDQIISYMNEAKVPDHHYFREGS